MLITRTVPLLAILAAGVAGDAMALTDEEIFRELRVNLINPGARARGIGGAFVSLADDATAAQSNPSGLAFLRRSEYFAELRTVDNTTETRAASETLPTIGVETAFVTGTDTDDSFGFSFLSAVIPRGDWTVGFSLQDVLNIDSTTLSSFAFTFPGSPGIFLSEQSGAVDVDVRNANVSVGYRVTDHLGVGGTLTYSRLEARSQVVNTVVDTQPNLASEPVLEPTLDLRTEIDDSDDDLAFSLGLIYKRPEKLGLGVVYRRAPRFEVEQLIDPMGIDVFGTRQRLGNSFPNELNLPDSFGIGGNYLLLDQRLTLALDVEWIRYSSLVDGFVAGVNLLTNDDAVFDIDDGIDTRFGTEYVLYNQKNALPPMALRGGVFLESDTTITARSLGQASFSSREVFSGRDRQEHLTLGLGFVFQRFKIDVAADFAETDNEYLASIIFRK